jgi:hypothetical protein
VKVLSEKAPIGSIPIGVHGKTVLALNLEGMSFAEMVNEIGSPTYTIPSESVTSFIAFQPFLSSDG